MPSKNSTVRKLKSKTLTDTEVQRIAEKLAVALGHEAEEIGLITLLFDHLEAVADEPSGLFSSIYTIKTHLFLGTSAAEQAQEQFLANAYKNRGTLLRWPNEKEAS